MENKEPSEVQAVSKTLGILEALADKGEMSLTELSAHVGSHKSTVYRFMCTLIEKGYVRRDADTDQYSLTLKLFQLGMCTYERVDIIRFSQPVLKRLSVLSEETVHLAVLEENRLTYLSKIESSHTLRVSMQSRVGSTAPEYCTGVGKVLLAWMESNELDQYLGTCDFFKFTDKTIADRLSLAAELQTIRQQGYAFDDEEHEYGVRCAAAPVRDYSGRVIASVSVSGPTVRLADERMAALRDLVISSAGELSESMGYDKNNKARHGFGHF